MTGGGKTNILDVIREAVTAMDDAVLVNLNGAGSGDERAWEPLSLLTAAGLQEDDPGVREKIMGALRWVRHLIGERAESAAETGDSVFQPTRKHPAVVVIADEIDETAKPEGASKILEFLASKQRKAAVILILAGQRATATWTGGAGVRINLSTVVTGMLARDSESRHAVGAENEIPDISEYSGGEAGFFQIWSVRAKKILARGRGFYIGRIGDQQQEIISKRDPAARPVLEGAGVAPETAPRERPGSALRERLAKVQALNEDRPLPAGAPPGAALPVVSGVPPEIAAGLVRVLAGGALPASAAGQALSMSKSAAHRYLSALREAGVVETTGAGRAIKWRLVSATPAAAQPQPYTTIEALAQAVHDGLVDATGEQREVLEQAWQITQRPRLTLLQGGGGGGGGGQ
jgi:DNA-binding transcriptional ArsR family regulator